MRRLRAAAAAYSRHACGELAAAIAYRVLFAIVPSLALLAAVLDAVLPRTVRVAFVEWLLGAFPGTTVESSVEQELANAGALTSLTGAVAFVTLLWTASGMTRSLRVALGVVWDTDLRPKFVRAKLRDVAVLGALAALVLAVFLLSLAAQIAVQAGVDLSAALGLGDAADVIARAADLTVIGAASTRGPRRASSASGEASNSAPKSTIAAAVYSRASSASSAPSGP